MKLREYLDLPTLNSTKETYSIQDALTGYGIPFVEENNHKVTIETVFEDTDGYRGVWIYRIIFEKTVVAIAYASGRDGKDNNGKYILNRVKFKDMIKYLMTATMEDFEDEDLEVFYLDDDFSEIQGYDIKKNLNPVSLKTDLKIGDILKLDLELIGDSLKKEIFKECSCEIKNIDLNSDLKTMELLVLNLKIKDYYWNEYSKEIENHFGFNSAVTIDHKFIIPQKNWYGNDWTTDQLKVLEREKDEIKNPLVSISLEELALRGVQIFIQKK